MNYLRVLALIIIGAWLVGVSSAPTPTETLAAPPTPPHKQVGDLPFVHVSQLPPGPIVGSHAPTQQNRQGGFTEGELIVGTSSEKRMLAVDIFSQVPGISIKSEIPEIGATVISVPVGEEDATASSLRRSGVFSYAERSTIVTLPPSPANQARPPAADSFLPQLSPNDPLYSLQWALSKINAPQGWDISRGSSSVLVAVIDTGYDVGHPDQPANLYLGRDFIAGGYVSNDSVGHGTHVAGIIAAKTNNAVGVASLAHYVSIGVVRVLGPSGGSASNLADGIIWASNAGS